MKNSIIIEAALANLGPNKNSELLNFLKDNINSDEIKIYKRDFLSSQIVASATDWYMVFNVLGGISSIITIGHVFWKAYEKFIVPNKDKKEFKPFIFIRMENDKRNFYQFMLNQEHYETEEVFITEFTEKVKKITKYNTEITSDTKQVDIKIKRKKL